MIFQQKHLDGVILNRSQKSCNNRRCPPCFSLTSTSDMVLRHATFNGCSTMLLSDKSGIQLGSGAYQNGMEQLSFFNRNEKALNISKWVCSTWVWQMLCFEARFVVSSNYGKERNSKSGSIAKRFG
jgi:hypothetical protein